MSEIPDHYVIRYDDDGQPRLTCTKCYAPDFGIAGELVLCDVEHDDTLRVLAAVAANHEEVVHADAECECSDSFTASLTGHGHACPLYNETE